VEAAVAVWDKDSSPVVEERVDFGVGVHEDVLIERGFLRVGFGAAEIGGGSLEAVVEHVLKSIASAESSSFEEEDKLISLGSNVNVHGGRRAIETSGTGIFIGDLMEEEVEGLGVGKGADEQEEWK
jgi:hypothetical protein